MTKPKPLPKKAKGSLQKQQKTGQPQDLLSPKTDIFQNRTILLIIILVITFFAFLPSLSNQFITSWDDGTYVTENPLIRHLNWESIRGFFTTQKNGTYVPLPLVSWAMEFKFFGLNPFPYHLDNLLLHLLCTSLVFYFLQLLGLPPLYAAIGALLFGIHPMRVESVAWITERKDLLFCLFYLGSLTAYSKYILTNHRKPLYFLLSLLLFIFSLFSKIQAVSLPFSIILLDYWFDRSWKLKLLWEKIPFFLLSLGFGIGGYLLLQKSSAIGFHDQFHLTERILFGLYSLNVYLIRLIAPLHLSSYYPYPVEPGDSLPLLYYLNPIVLIGIAVMVFLTARKTKAVVFGFLFFLFNVIFLLQFVRAGQAYQADRFTYVSYIGLFFLAAWGAHKFANRNKASQRIIGFIGLVFTIFFFANTYARCKDWKDSITLWNDVIEKFPSTIPTAYYNRGLAFANLGQWDKAIADYSEVIRINPKDKDTYSNRGIAYKNLGQFDKSIADYTMAIMIDPDYAGAYYNRGLVNYGLRQLENAIADYTKAIEIRSNYTEAYNNRGVAYEDLGQWDMAIRDYSRAIEINPAYKDAYFNRAPSYAHLGQWDKAIADYTETIVMDPNSKDAYFNRGLSYVQIGQWNNAISDFTKVIGIDPANADAYNNLGNVYFTLGQWQQAIAGYSRALALNPDNPTARYNLDVAIRKSGSGK